MLLGGLEAGGTKMVCAVGDENGKLLDRASIPTRTPDETFPELIAYFKKWELAALGIGSFGPLDLTRSSKSYGCITRTPKQGWSGVNLVQHFSDALHIPVGLDTDVNAAVLAEVEYGAAKGCESAIYITVGTGVGVGVYCNGGLVHGLVHPEGGHMLLKKEQGDTYGGCCPFHGNCVEGLASGPAILGRYGKSGKELADKPEVWELESAYLAQAIANYIMLYSPQKIILWGGVMHQDCLFPLVRTKVQKLLNGYIYHPTVLEHMDDYIVAPGLGDDPGVLGSILLGVRELKKEESGC